MEAAYTWLTTVFSQIEATLKIQSLDINLLMLQNLTYQIMCLLQLIIVLSGYS